MNTLKKLFDLTFWKFIAVGVINTLVGTSIMFIMYNVVKCNYWVSSASNYIAGSIVSYILNKHFTFKNTDSSPRVTIRFVVNISICYFLAYGIAKPIAIRVFSQMPSSIQENLAMIVGMGLFVILNYLSQRFITFRMK